MAHPLDGVDLRLRRADECLALLEKQRGTFLSKPYRIIGHYDAEVREYAFRVEREPPPLEWGLILGEYAHCMRAALDNTLWQLVIARGGTPTRQTQFPIYEQETDSQGKSNAAKARRQADGVLPEDFAFIEGRQPYHARRNAHLSDLPPLVRKRQADILAAYHPLAMLGYLNDIDKHRYMHASWAAVNVWSKPYGYSDVMPLLLASGRLGAGYGRQIVDIIGEVSWPKIVGDSIVSRGATRFGISDDDPAEIARVLDVVPAPGREARMQMKPGPDLEISFSDRHRPMTQWDLTLIRIAVHEIIDRFRPEIR